MNGKGYLPRLPEGHAGPPSRGRFLDGTVKAFYAPGQRPDAGEAYDAPTDWPQAGTLLRVPQVVWLSASVPEPWRARVSLDYGQAGVSGGEVVQGVLSVANQDQVSYLAWLAVLAAVKARVEAVRPGRTWVHVVDWYTWEPGPDSARPTFAPFTGVGPLASYDYRYLAESPGYLHLRCPPGGGPGGFFGTDFLHLYVGHWARDKWSRRGFSTPDVTPPAESDYFLADRANLVANAERFRRYAVRCYGYTQTWEHFPPAVSGDRFGNPVGSGTFNDYLAGINSDHDTNPTDSNAVLAATCGAMAAALDGTTADVAYAGLIDGLTADDLVAALAEHFGFDPDTGADLG